MLKKGEVIPLYVMARKSFRQRVSTVTEALVLAFRVSVTSCVERKTSVSTFAKFHSRLLEMLVGVGINKL